MAHVLKLKYDPIRGIIRIQEKLIIKQQPEQSYKLYMVLYVVLVKFLMFGRIAQEK